MATSALGELLSMLDIVNTNNWASASQLNISYAYYSIVGSLVVEIDVPGFEKGEVSVTSEKNRITVTALRKEQPKKDPSRILVHRRRTGESSTAFTVSNDFDVQKVEASMNNGILTLNIPKTLESSTRTVKIN